MDNKPSIFSFFSGAGFLDMGFEQDYEIVFVNEYHEPFLETYKYSRKKMNIDKPRYGYHCTDITKYVDNPARSELKKYIDLSRNEQKLIGFLGGPPCPDFSVGGKNQGSEGENGKLTATYVELICQQQPDFFILENVKGLWGTKKHRIFYDSMLEKLKLNGYVTTDRLINALEYGVPQNRERIILFGVKSSNLLNQSIESDLSEIFPWQRHLKHTMEAIKLIQWPTQEQFVIDGTRECPEGVNKELTVEHWFDKNNVESHPNHRTFTPKAGLVKFLVVPEGDDSKKSYKRLHRWRYSPTAAYGNNEVHLHPYKARRLTISEALAIQSLPKEFELPLDITLSNAFKTVGNGVPFLAAKGIANTVMDFLQLISKKRP